jgi:uncharacterized protein involved in exopolysaccharide biosynthesis
MADSKTPQNNPASGTERPELEIDLAALWRVVLARRKLVAKITAAFTVLSVIYALILPPVYRAQVLLMPVNQSQGSTGVLTGQFSELAALTGFGFTGASDASVQRALATLKSRVMTEAFMKEAGVLQAMYPAMWDAEKKAWKPATGWFGSSNQSAGPSMESAYRAFDQGIRTVNFDRKTNLTTVTIDWSDPQIAAQWANRLVKKVNSQLQGEAVKDAEQNIVYLREQLKTNSAVEMQQAIYNLIEAQMKNIMVASTRDDYAFKVIDPAVPPEQKIKPSRRLIVMVGLFLGLLAGIATVFLLPHIQPLVQSYVQPWITRWRKRKAR